MKMIIELNATEAKNSVKSGALLTMLETLADFEKEIETPAINFVNAFKEATIEEPQNTIQPQTTMQNQAPSQPQNFIQSQTPIQQPQQYQQIPVQQPVMSTPTAPVQQSAAPVQSPAAPTVVPTSQAPTYTMEQLAVAATQLIDAGKMNVLHGILNSFGVVALNQLPKERYGEFATALRQNGVKI